MNRISYYIFSFIICIIINSKTSSAQGNYIDSLNKKRNEYLSFEKGFQRDTNLINIYDKLAWEKSYERPDSAILISEEIYNIAQSALKNEGIEIEAFLKQTNVKLSVEQKEYVGAMARHFHNCGEFHRLRGSFPSSIESSLKALAIWEKLNDQKYFSQKTATLSNIGIFYSEQKDYDKALKYFNKVLSMDKEKNDKVGIAVDLGNMAIIYAEKNDYPKALEMLFEGIKINEELGNTNGIAIKLGNVGIIYKKQAEKLSSEKKYSKDSLLFLLNKALKYFNEALALSEKAEHKHSVSINSGNLGELYVLMNDFKKASHYFLASLEIDKQIGFKQHEMTMYESLYKMYDKNNDFKNGYYYYKKYSELLNSLNDEESIKQVVKNQMLYEFDKKEIQRKAEQERKDIISEQKQQKQKIIIYMISLAAILLSILLFFIYKSNQAKQKSNIEITKQKLLVDAKQKEIIDSINYAKRIQQSILPNEKYIEKKLKR